MKTEYNVKSPEGHPPPPGAIRYLKPSMLQSICAWPMALSSCCWEICPEDTMP